jgi:hypothetical protein
MSLLSDQPRESKKPPTGAASSCTWMVHVHYEMMMIAARRVASGEITATFNRSRPAGVNREAERRPPPRGNQSGEVG